MVATTMSSLFVALFALVTSSFRTRASLQAEILALRHQLAVFQRNAPHRLRLQRSDRLLWVLLSRSPWQNPFAERVVGSIRRECLDHIIVWDQRSLQRTLQSYFAYDQRSRTHLALAKDAPEHRAVEPPQQGRVVAIPQVGGLHHRYQRRAA